MSYSIKENHERQSNEMTALASIYNEREFFYTTEKRIKCTANIFPNFPKKLEVRFTNCCSDAVSDVPCDSIFVEYLPSINLCIYLPDTYPSEEPPHFHLDVMWLPPWKVSFVCQKLDEIWEENRRSEIIFLWLDFLRNNFFDFLGISDFIDVSFMNTVCSTFDDQLAVLCDPRVVIKALSLDIKQLLISYNEKQRKLQFDKDFYNCDICFEQYNGLQCIELQTCRHIYCKTCIQEHIRSKLMEYNKAILCPSVDCDCEIDANDIKTLCPNWFSRYEEIMLRVALDTMGDVIYCPRTFCQYPVIRDENDPAPICYNCTYCFCIYCRKVYHGNTPCQIVSADFKKLIDEYRNSNTKQKKLLEKKYGKRQIQVIEKHLTMKYLKENAKQCPKCHSYISKTEGCHKMTCRHCSTQFCWLCDKEIKSANPYNHYSDVNSPCFNRLFPEINENDDFMNYILV